MFYDPIQQGLFKANVVTGLLTFDPLVAQNLFPLRKEFLVKERLADEFSRIFCRGAHGCSYNF